MSKKKNKGRIPAFVALHRHTLNSAAWKAMSGGAKATFIALKYNYSYDSQNAVFISSRDGAEQLGVTKDTIGEYLRELEYYGFIAMVRDAHLGSDGEGKAAHYRITDCVHAGKPPTREFEKWDGVLFDPEDHPATGKKPTHRKKPQQPKKQNPVRKIRTPCPKNSDIREDAGMSLNGNKCPNFSDIRTEIECPDYSDITIIPLPESSKHKLEWSMPVLTEIEYTPELRELYKNSMIVVSPYLAQQVRNWVQ
jgi:hypothetical protein